jgi:HlyD family secretion protein
VAEEAAAGGADRVARIPALRIGARARRWVIALGVVIAGGLVYVAWHRQPAASAYVTRETSRGAVVRTITTTGAVDPVITVLVGAYVSGTVISTSCDFNTEVKAGQLCAKIDPRPYQVVVDQDTANLANSRAALQKDQASLAYAKISYERDAGLLAKGVVSRDTVDSDKSVYDQAAAQVKVDESVILQRQAELHAAQVNLDYTNIISPVDGTVVSRSITIGQTVAASFQTPTLFLIAQDLTKMQVDTNVSESDVGIAKVGQKATFTVEAYPDRTFEGRISQVREAPITVQNVVTYDVVIGVDNDDLALLPGMTANTRIITDERDDVVRVPLRALRFTPQGLRHSADEPRGAEGKKGGRAGREAGVWVERDGGLKRIAVVTGLNDGTWVEVVRGDLKPGDPVVIDEATHEEHGPSSAQPTRPRFHF